jgi:D-tyrosyl-tRNA(Tyr) deacylase
MRAVIQRVSSAKVVVEEAVVGEIGAGLLILLGIQTGDSEDDARWLAEKCAALRIFPDSEGKMNRSVAETGGRVLVISQFTLIASTKKGARPSFNDAAKPSEAIPLYENFVRRLEGILGQPVGTGKFGAMMAVQLTNDGPVTLVIDTRQRE